MKRGHTAKVNLAMAKVQLHCLKRSKEACQDHSWAQESLGKDKENVKKELSLLFTVGTHYTETTQN